MKRYKIALFIIIAVSAAVGSCSKLLDVTPDEVLLKEDYLGNDRLDARAALFGVLSQMQDLSTQYLILGELRGDLMDVTTEAIDELRQVSQHNVAEGNKYATVADFYSIINNCNFALKGMDTAAYESGLMPVYASLLRVRTWVFLQVAINYGSVPYITDPIESSADLEKEFPLLSFDETMDALIADILPVSTIDNVSTYDNSLSFVIYSLIPDKDLLLGDLYNWKNDYVNGATSYKAFLDRYTSGSSAKYNLTSKYGVTYSVSNFVYNITNNWKNIYQTTIQTDEIVNYIPFSRTYRQTNSGFNLLTKQVKSSEAAFRNWDKQFKIHNNILFDSLDTRAIMADRTSGKILKYLDNYIVYTRVPTVYIRLAEMINRAGFPDHALSIINKGVKDDAVTSGAPRFVGNLETYLNFTQTKYYVVSSSGVASGGNLGVRGRVGMAPVSIAAQATLADSIKAVEMLILNEAALESAFEGSRWADLTRIATRNNDPSILADAVANKFSLAGDNALAASIRTKLMDINNWYLPLEIPANFVEQ